MKNRVGEINYNNFGSKMEIINYRDANNIDIYFEEYDCIVKNKQYKNILGIESNLICSDLNTLSFPKTENEKFIEIINKYKMSELDVVIKKF